LSAGLAREDHAAGAGTITMAAARMVAALRFLSAKPRMIALYLLCALPLGMFMAMAVPPGQAPDEPAHMARAEGLLRGAVMAVRKGEDATGVKVDSGLFLVSFGKVTQIDGRPVMTLADYQALRNQPPWHVLSFAVINNTGPYFPAAYFPATLGLALGLAFNLSPFITMILARLCMLAACLLLGSLALLVAAYGEALLLCLLLLPMTISLSGSLSQDGVLIGMACLSAAALTRDARSWKFRWLALLPLVLILGSKPPYLPLLGLALLPLNAAGLRRRVRDMALAAAPVLIWTALIVAFVIVPFDRGPYHPGPLFPGDRHILLQQVDAPVNFHILLARPARFFTMPAQLLAGSWWLLLREMIGILGWVNLMLPQRLYVCWTLALAVALLGLVFAARRPTPPIANKTLQPVYVALLLLLSVWAVAISMYVSWTWDGDAVIDGVQGRYFLLLLPFLLPAVQPWRGWQNLPAITPALPAIALGLYDLGFVPMKIIAFYYMY
jgi:uncharacterized membrane protein